MQLAVGGGGLCYSSLVIWVVCVNFALNIHQSTKKWRERKTASKKYFFDFVEL